MRKVEQNQFSLYANFVGGIVMIFYLQSISLQNIIIRNVYSQH